MGKNEFFVVSEQSLNSLRTDFEQYLKIFFNALANALV